MSNSGVGSKRRLEEEWDKPLFLKPGKNPTPGRLQQDQFGVSQAESAEIGLNWISSGCFSLYPSLAGEVKWFRWIARKEVVACPWWDGSDSERGLITPRSKPFSCSDTCLGWGHMSLHARKRWKLIHICFSFPVRLQLHTSPLLPPSSTEKRKIKGIKPPEGDAVVWLVLTYYYYFSSSRLARTCKFMVPTGTVTWPPCEYIKALKLTPYTVMQNSTYVQETWFMGLVKLRSDLVQIQPWFKHCSPAGLCSLLFILKFITANCKRSEECSFFWMPVPILLSNGEWERWDVG